jgi:outer membrane protein assembly factor BamB
MFTADMPATCVLRHPIRRVVGDSCLAWGVLVLLASGGMAADWPTFRGPDRAGVAPDTGLLDTWPATGPHLIWETAGAGHGYASLAIAGQRIYTLGDGLSTAGDKDEYLSCFDRDTGKQLWKTKTGQPWAEGPESWHSSRSTPTVDGDTVYVITPFGQLVACATADGKERFRVDLKAQFGGKKGDG